MTTKPRKLAPLPAQAKTAPTPTERFIRGAPGKEQLPWKNPMVRDDLMVQVNVKQPEKLKKMIEFFAHAFHQSERKFIEDSLYAICRRHIEDFGLEE